MIGVIAGELYGFTDAYLHKMVFLRLVRRDIVAQAVSTAKAVQTQQWHLFDKPAGRAAYDGEQIAAAVRRIARGVDDLRQYVHLTDRPSRLLIYEDFSGDDFTPALQACNSLGVPRHLTPEVVAYRPVERMGDETNLEWQARFSEEMDAATKDEIQRYLEDLDS